MCNSPWYRKNTHIPKLHIQTKIPQEVLLYCKLWLMSRRIALFSLFLNFVFFQIWNNLHCVVIRLYFHIVRYQTHRFHTLIYEIERITPMFNTQNTSKPKIKHDSKYFCLWFVRAIVDLVTAHIILQKLLKNLCGFLVFTWLG